MNTEAWCGNCGESFRLAQVVEQYLTGLEQGEPLDAEAQKRADWRQHGILVVAEQDPRRGGAHDPAPKQSYAYRFSHVRTVTARGLALSSTRH